jgi:hypothetical protein
MKTSMTTEAQEWLKDVGITETVGEKLLLRIVEVEEELRLRLLRRLLQRLQSENVTKHEMENEELRLRLLIELQSEGVFSNVTEHEVENNDN